VEFSDIGRIAQHVKEGEERKEGKDGNVIFLTSVGSQSMLRREKKGKEERMRSGYF
jgi:hypothetical protein